MLISDLLRDPLVDYARLWYNRLRFPGRTVASPHVGQDVRLGARCHIGKGVILGRGVAIGDYSFVNQGTIIASGTVGKFSSIAYYCQIGMAEHPVDHLSTSPFLYGPNSLTGAPSEWGDYFSPPAIGNDVWVGSHVVVLQGVKIGDGAIVAAGAVVTSDVPPYTIVGGVPARVIRRRIEDQGLVDRLLRWRWWDHPNDLPRHAALFRAGPAWREHLASFDAKGESDGRAP